MLIAAFGITAPDSSVTAPEILPMAVWARSTTGITRRTNTHIACRIFNRLSGLRNHMPMERLSQRFCSEQASGCYEAARGIHFASGVLDVSPQAVLHWPACLERNQNR